jgi:hypothetical protein
MTFREDIPFRRCTVVRIPTFAGRSDATATNDENGDGVVDSRDDAPVNEQIDERAERKLVRARRDDTSATPVVAPPTATGRVAVDPAGRVTDADGRAVPDPDGPVVTDRDGRVVPHSDGRAVTDSDGRVVTDPDGRVVTDPATTGRVGSGPVVADPESTGRLRAVPAGTVVTEPDGTEPDGIERADDVEPAAVPKGPRPRASLFATLGLLFGVVSAAAVLTGVLADFGIALGVVGALCSLGGFSATARRHVAGRFDAVLGFVLSLAAVVLGILAVTDSLSWLSLDTDTIPAVRDWLHQQWNALTGS